MLQRLENTYIEDLGLEAYFLFNSKKYLLSKKATNFYCFLTKDNNNYAFCYLFKNKNTLHNPLKASFGGIEFNNKKTCEILISLLKNWAKKNKNQSIEILSLIHI